MEKSNIVIVNNQPAPLKYFEKDFNTTCCNVEDIVVRDKWFGSQMFQKPVYFVSPANSLLFMDGGIDAAYCRMFPGIQQRVQNQLSSYSNAKTSLLGRTYLPVGSAMLHKISNEYSLICAPTMLLPQNVSETNNAYYAMKAVLKIWPGNGTLIIPFLGGGIGRIPIESVYEQMKKALFEEYAVYSDNLCRGPLYIPDNLEEIMDEQPKVYENSEFIKIDINSIHSTDVNKPRNPKLQ